MSNDRVQCLVVAYKLFLHLAVVLLLQLEFLAVEIGQDGVPGQQDEDKCDTSAYDGLNGVSALDLEIEDERAKGPHDESDVEEFQGSQTHFA